MKRNIFIACLSVLMFSSCMHKDSIEYSKMALMNLGDLQKESAKFGATVVFNNISEDPFVVKNLLLDLKVDGKDIGTILVKAPKTVRPHSEFSIEVNYIYETSRLLKAGEEPADVYLIQLEGDLTLQDQDGAEVKVPVKYKASYAYQTNREERIEKRKVTREEKKNKVKDSN